MRTKDKRPHYAQQLQAWREARGLTTLQVSEGAGVAHETVRYLERGARGPGYEVILKLAKFFGVSPREFFEA